ncbi:MAG: Rpn family recombination-promoting nuclease/putative transposase [Lachnospiraceae bacterium]|nr:Rpn family recombination-promoting nuclease/putative transposase [Lachnospiraceae bacterium]
MNQNNSIFPPLTLQNASGALPYGMTNDYLFRAVLQSNNKALRGLICSLLRLTEEDVVSITVTNPIILGKNLTSKECRLDINVLLNDHTRINLEMQVANKLNWQNRSIIYLCRSYDALEHGEDYMQLKPAMHIGFLDYTLFKEHPKFYASYKLIEAEDHYIYSDNFTLNVVDLTQIDLATEENIQYHIHYWAMLFKATTWEEIKMLASKDEYLKEAANSIFQFNTDEQIRKLCRDREEYYQDIHNYERVIAEKDAFIEKAVAENKRLRAEIEQLRNNP